ncbi:uncharacterized protein LAESUDRAFT_315542 [Laetiporus sulphureus 93-53]|uniref:Uncharacterized protein n=1 Tax=Laetiporus sulphureus 93-53 TaxID=1314785 RepID=A0A165D2E2_9APHY|nr:uncharacterized protein LAESUDRAFT_315542 [Laetiporus sulphureus 93-53]KZT04017.1 hypothetical protein LAESUDRAFT_315542 [Laetiporus sulphureus 93-53]
MSFAHGDTRGDRQNSALSRHPLETRHAPGPASIVPASTSTQSSSHRLGRAGSARSGIGVECLRSRRPSSSWICLAGRCIGADARWWRMASAYRSPLRRWASRPSSVELASFRTTASH